MAMESLPVSGAQPAHQELYNGFTWLEEDDELDLRLTLDSHRVDPKKPATSHSNTTPSLFRRRMSGNKLSISRPSVSSHEPFLAEQAPVQGHVRRKSRALSLITPKNGLHELPVSPALIDTAATHYQDPEARHKLRAYLSSPQKFDEAVKFGFPANTIRPVLESGVSRDFYIGSSEKLKTFLADDDSSISSDETSVPEPESPITPLTPDNHSKPFPTLKQTSSFPPRKFSDSSDLGLAASREMTLRMTLTRPDLRCPQDELYGLSSDLVPARLSQSQSQLYPYQVVRPGSLSDNKAATKESIDQIFADIDRELSATSSSEGVVKRLWNKVRRL